MRLNAILGPLLLPFDTRPLSAVSRNPRVLVSATVRVAKLPAPPPDKPRTPQKPKQKPQVVFLHGLARNKESMEGLARHVEEASGLRCHCIGYPSMSLPLPELAVLAAASIRQATGKDVPVWAVTHSMGGIVLRHIQALPEAGGVQWCGSCMIAPPNRGSMVAQKLCQFPHTRALFSLIFGVAGMQLARPEDSHTWPAPPVPCGIIAGSSSLALTNPTSWMTKTLGFLPEDSDGTVAVEETRLPPEMMTDFVSVPVAHTFIMQDQAVKDHVVAFISKQEFSQEFFDPRTGSESTADDDADDEEEEEDRDDDDDDEQRDGTRL